MWRQNAVAAFSPESDSLFNVTATRAEVIRVTILGAIVGLLVPLIGWLIAEYFIKPVFCGSQGALGVCSSGGIIANHVAAVVLMFGAFVLLTQWAIFRALLLVAASTVTLWGLAKYAEPIISASWFEYLALSVVLYAVAFITFYWLLRIRNFALSFGAIIVTVVAACVALAV